MIELKEYYERMKELVQEWSACGLPYHNFIYLGVDYLEKMEDDNKSILEMFPSLVNMD